MQKYGYSAMPVGKCSGRMKPFGCLTQDTNGKCIDSDQSSYNPFIDQAYNLLTMTFVGKSTSNKDDGKTYCAFNVTIPSMASYVMQDNNKTRRTDGPSQILFGSDGPALTRILPPGLYQEIATKSGATNYQKDIHGYSWYLDGVQQTIIKVGWVWGTNAPGQPFPNYVGIYLFTNTGSSLLQKTVLSNGVPSNTFLPEGSTRVVEIPLDFVSAIPIYPVGDGSTLAMEYSMYTSETYASIQYCTVPNILLPLR